VSKATKVPKSKTGKKNAAKKAARGKTAKASREQDPPKIGRPKLELDERQVRMLARIDCTYDEIAAVMQCSTKTLHRHFKTIITDGRLEGNAHLRKRLYLEAENGNTPVLLHLSRVRLGQKESLELTGRDGESLAPPPNITAVFVSKEAVLAARSLENAKGTPIDLALPEKQDDVIDVPTNGNHAAG
jgi:hypothetical protein